MLRKYFWVINHISNKQEKVVVSPSLQEKENPVELKGISARKKSELKLNTHYKDEGEENGMTTLSPGVWPY